MPGGDRTGPAGSGPKTGRGLGYCADNEQPGYATAQSSQRFGRGISGRGRGWRNRFNTGFGRGRGRGGFGALPVSDNQDFEALKTENQELHSVLQQILEKLDKLGS